MGCAPGFQNFRSPADQRLKEGSHKFHCSYSSLSPYFEPQSFIRNTDKNTERQLWYSKVKRNY